MTDENWKLSMTFAGPFGEHYTMAIGINGDIARSISYVRPSARETLAMALEGDTFDGVVERLHQKQYRKDLFINEASRLGTLLAERMEDAEGWHDESRIELAREQLKERS